MYSSISSRAALRAVPTRLVVVAGLHVAAIWALINGLHLHALTNALPQVSEATVIDQPPMPTEPVTQKAPTLRTETEITEVKPVVDPIDEKPPQHTDDPVFTAPPGPGTIFPIPTPAPVVTGAAVDPRRPLTQPAYPPAAIRGNEEGALNLAILVGTDGRVRDVKVAESSGSSRLDQAAMSEAKSHWRLRPAMRDGAPFEQWLTLRVVFHLENR
jgi:periplasmic protein TonB